MQVAELESQGAHDSPSENNKEELSQTLEELELLIKAKDEVKPHEAEQRLRQGGLSVTTTPSVPTACVRSEGPSCITQPLQCCPPQRGRAEPGELGAPVRTPLRGGSQPPRRRRGCVCPVPSQPPLSLYVVIAPCFRCIQMNDLKQSFNYRGCQGGRCGDTLSGLRCRRVHGRSLRAAATKQGLTREGVWGFLILTEISSPSSCLLRLEEKCWGKGVPRLPPES